MFKIKLNKILLCSILLLGGAFSLSLSLTSCTKKNNSSGSNDYNYDQDSTKYNASGNNWKGYINGELTLELVSTGDVHTAYVKNNTSYEANDLIIPKSIFSGDIEYIMNPTNFVLSSNNITGTILIPPSFTFIGGNSNISINCPNADSVIIPESVTALKSKCINVKDLNIPNTVTSIGVDAFKDCISLTSVSISSNVKAISNSAFQGCSSLASVSIPVGVETIGDSAFESCSALAAVVIPQGVTSIGSSSFSNCAGVKLLSIPSSLTSVGDNSFHGWQNSSLWLPKRQLYLPKISSNTAITNWTGGTLVLFGSFTFSDTFWYIVKI